MEDEIVKKIRTMIVDDEPLARKRIRTLLVDHEDIDVIDEATNGKDAIVAIRDHKPDLVFLDVQMPKVDGFRVLEALASEDLPVIIFVTAYEEHAIRAFEINALDYVLKPFDTERFTTAVERAREQIELRQVGDDGLRQRLLGVLEELKAPEQYRNRLTIKAQGRIYVLDVEKIDWVEAADKYVRIHSGKDEHLLREPIHHLQRRLDPSRFVRIHRSTIVNLSAVRELKPLVHGEYRVYLRDATELTLSRTCRARLLEGLEAQRNLG